MREAEFVYWRRLVSDCGYLQRQYRYVRWQNGGAFGLREEDTGGVVIGFADAMEKLHASRTTKYGAKLMAVIIEHWLKRYMFSK